MLVEELLHDGDDEHAEDPAERDGENRARGRHPGVKVDLVGRRLRSGVSVVVVMVKVVVMIVIAVIFVDFLAGAEHGPVVGVEETLALGTANVGVRVRVIRVLLVPEAGHVGARSGLGLVAVVDAHDERADKDEEDPLGMGGVAVIFRAHLACLSSRRGCNFGSGKEVND